MQKKYKHTKNSKQKLFKQKINRL